LVCYSWRQIVAEQWDEEEAMPFHNEFNFFYRIGLVIYIDLYANLGAMDCSPAEIYKPADVQNELINPALSTVQAMKLKVLWTRLLVRGAMVASSLHRAVTHVIAHHDPAAAAMRYEVLLERCEMFGVDVVTTAWAEECLACQQIVEVRPEHRLLGV
jgi:hypothetical protein